MDSFFLFLLLYDEFWSHLLCWILDFSLYWILRSSFFYHFYQEMTIYSACDIAVPTFLPQLLRNRSINPTFGVNEKLAKRYHVRTMDHARKKAIPRARLGACELGTHVPIKESVASTLHARSWPPMQSCLPQAHPCARARCSPSAHAGVGWGGGGLGPDALGRLPLRVHGAFPARTQGWPR